MKLSKSKAKYIAKAEKVLGKYNIATPEETIDKIIKDKVSITRFGDGEFDMIYGIGMNYQKYNLVKVIGVLENSKTYEGIEESIFSF